MSEKQTILRSSFLRHSILALALLAGGTGTFAITGCETTAGAGRDVQAVGQGVEGAADEVNPNR